MRHATNFPSAIALLLPLAIAGMAASGQQRQAPQTAVEATFRASDFEKQIRPLLITSCAGCHGKDSPQAGLRLDVPFAIDKARLVMARVRGQGGKPRMPLGGQLTPAQIAALDSWVAAGAHWPDASPVKAGPDKRLKHWAFQPISDPHVPAVRNTAWVRNPIDAFVLRGLEATGLKPSPTASRDTLIRRVTYDLTGLPPTPEEVAAFEADHSPDAYPHLVDRLLASPHYGEKWARHWLDLVRYAETNSYERDNPKPYAYKYRDYVIRAFNSDKPFDRFVREQLSGDEMPYTGDAVAATGYYRLGTWDDEPADLKQAIADDTDDLVTTTGQAFLGLTIDCARCHDHKFDPIPQKDYYRFAAFFSGVNRFKNGGATDEALYFPTAAQRDDYLKKTADLEARRKANDTQIAKIEAMHRELRSRIMNAGDLSNLHYRYFEEGSDHFPDFTGVKPTAVGALNPSFIDIRAHKRDENFGFVFEGMLNVPRAGEYTFYLDSDDGSRLTVGSRVVLEKNMPGGQGTEVHSVVTLQAGSVPFRLDYVQAVGPFGLSVAWGGPGFPRRALSTLESCGAMGIPTLVSAEISVLWPGIAPRYAALVKEREQLAKGDLSAEKVLAVTEAGATAPDTFVLARGNASAPGDKVDPAYPLCARGGPAIISQPPKGAPSSGRRSALADWIASPENPLTARVIVNRVWQWHFGRGIVRTSSDFGLQGTRPTQPELLDWLARLFVARGWSIKELTRLILLSNTYKQSSQGNPTGLARDPRNDLFWRFDMRRLDAEEIRDSVLAVSGNLNQTLFGPSVYPEIPKEILAGQSIPGYGWDTTRMSADDVNRRSIYIHVKRSLVYPMLATFDLPETDRTTPVRFASTQPTQALGMLNGPLINKQAAVLAARVRKEVGKEPRAFARRMLRLTLQREPQPGELAACGALVAKLEKRGAKPDAALTDLCLMALNLDEFMYLD